MKHSFRISLLILMVLLGGAGDARAQQAPDPRVVDLVQAGRIRVALFFPMYAKDPATGELRGFGPGPVLIDVARALVARLGVELVLTGYRTPSEVVECLKGGACDVAYLGHEPSRAGDVDFSPPLLELDYTYLVPAGSPIRSFADADRPGVRIAVVRSHASTLALDRILKHAEQVSVEIPDAAFDLLRSGRVDVFASVRSALLDYRVKLTGSSVLEDRYGANRLAVAVPKGHAGRLAYVSAFVEEAKASGLVQRSIERAGLGGVQVAPPRDSE